MWSPSPGPAVDAVTKEGTHKGCPYGLRYGYGCSGSVVIPGKDSAFSGTVPVRIVGATLVVALFLAA